MRRDAGMFDVSHMTVVDPTGRAHPRVPAPPGRQLGGQAAEAGQQLPPRCSNPQGGVIDDLIVYFMSEDWFRWW